MFEAIDTNHDGSLDRSEMQRAFRKAGLTVSNAKLEQFFSTIDTNHDGMVSFDEWRCACD
jgi:solute carrier family 25 phosphate transporter 23/24/25/41